MIIVTGTGRSGTSAVARVLHGSGISMGRDLLPPAHYNATGFYEERPVIELNDAIVRDCGLHEWFGYASRAQVLAAAEPYRERMARLAAEAEGGWKDPRFCWTLEAWLPLLPRKPRLVVCLRNPYEVMESTVHSYGLTDPKARPAVEFVWTRQYLRLLRFIREFRLDATVVEYEQLIAAPVEAVERLARFVGRSLDPAFVEGSLRHHAASSMPPRLARIYRLVQSLAVPTPEVTTPRP